MSIRQDLCASIRIYAQLCEVMLIWQHLCVSVASYASLSRFMHVKRDLCAIRGFTLHLRINVAKNA